MAESKKVRLYLAVDIGGTKIQACLAEESGSIRARHKCPTPREGGPEPVLATLEGAIQKVLDDEGLESRDVTAMGIAVPGVVDPEEGLVVVTPNMSLTGVSIGPHIESKFGVPVAVGNDCNLGTLGEAWLGSARGARSVVGILVGTGIGSGIVYGKGKMWRGERESAAEIGHMVMQIGGPRCGCGNDGCFEALASRSAIERDLRAAVEAGRTTVLTEILDGDLSVVRSGALRQALEQNDALVTEVLGHAAEVLGHACLTIRHLIDPEVIVLGGGVVEACSAFILPIVERIVGADKLPGARPGGRVLLSALGDDAVVLGAVALARQHVGRSAFKKKYDVSPDYPKIHSATFGQVTVGKKTHGHDIYIRADGKVKKRKKKVAKEHYGTSHTIGPEELDAVCKGGPQILFVGTGHSGQVQLSGEAERYLSQRAIEVRAMPTPEVAEAYNHSTRRRAALIHVTC